MPKILNYEKNETLATGFVRPKVTALFFDKIWIPESLLDSAFEYSGIPEEVLVFEKNELIIINKKRSNIAGQLYHRSIHSNRSIRIQSGDMYKLFEQANLSVLPNESSVPNGIFHTDDTEIKFKYSKHRNHAILVNSENFCRKYKLRISPIFHDLTEFEREAKSVKVEKLYNEGSLRLRFKNPNAFLNKDALSICIQDFPNIKEDELSWEQVLEIRKDKRRIQHLKNFTTWTNRILSNKSPDEIRESFEHELELYKDTLRKHGIKTTIGTFSTVVCGSSSIATLLTQPNSFVLPFLSLAAVILDFSVNTYYSNLDNKKILLHIYMILKNKPS